MTHTALHVARSRRTAVASTLALAVAALACSREQPPASATEALRRDAEIIGVASVIDGDTLEIHDRRIRLDGIDAPESAQLCLREGRK